MVGRVVTEESVRKLITGLRLLQVVRGMGGRA